MQQARLIYRQLLADNPREAAILNLLGAVCIDAGQLTEADEYLAEALRELRRDYPESPYLFVTERGGPMTPATARKLIARAGELAKLPFPIHPHMLRHSAGYKLANEGHDTRSIQQYLGHRNITHTVRYTELSPDRFKGFWKD